MNVQELQAHGINTRGKEAGQVKTRCPKCSDERKKKNDPSLSVDIDEGVWNCHHCGWSGSIHQYKRPEPRPHVKSEGIFKYFTDRAIKRETVDAFKISQGTEWMPQDQKEHAVVCFNYYEDGQLINIKFKTSDKKFKMVKDAKKIPYNIDSIKDSDKVIICEGEEETMCWHQAGFPFAVSVPNGASKTNNNLDWLNNCYDKFLDKTIYLATDNDEPGKKLAQDISRRFDTEDIRLIKFPEGQKDANDCLKAVGAECLKAIFNSAQHLPMAEISTTSEYKDTVLSYHSDGYPTGEKVEMNLTDKHLSWARGELVVVTGIPGSGKSTWLDYMYARLSFIKKWKFGIFSPENIAPLKITRLSEQILGKAMGLMTKAELNFAIEQINNHFYFYNTEEMEDYSIESILSLAKNMVRRYGIDCLCLDPFNYIESKRSKDESSNESIGNLLRELKRFAVKNNVNVTLVAHPRKMEKNSGSYSVPRLYDISGSHHFFNVPDVGIAVHRNYVDGENDPVEVHIQKVKYHFRGKLGMVEYRFDPPTGRYSESGFFKPLVDYVEETTGDMFGSL